MAPLRSISTKKDRNKLSMPQPTLRTRRISSSNTAREQEQEQDLDQMDQDQDQELENSAESSEDEIANPTQPLQRLKRKFPQHEQGFSTEIHPIATQLEQTAPTQPQQSIPAQSHQPTFEKLAQAIALLETEHLLATQQNLPTQQLASLVQAAKDIAKGLQPFQPSSLQEITAELQEVKRIVLEVVSSQQTRTVKATTGKQSYAAIAATGEKQSYAATAVIGSKGNNATIAMPARQTPKQRRLEQDQRQLVLVTTQEAEINPLEQRNAINEALHSKLGGTPVVASVMYSIRKNLILTITKEYNADFLL
jgi:hypothetical protein